MQLSRVNNCCWRKTDQRLLCTVARPATVAHTENLATSQKPGAPAQCRVDQSKQGSRKTEKVKVEPWWEKVAPPKSSSGQWCKPKLVCQHPACWVQQEKRMGAQSNWQKQKHELFLNRLKNGEVGVSVVRATPGCGHSKGTCQLGQATPKSDATSS